MVFGAEVLAFYPLERSVVPVFVFLTAPVFDTKIGTQKILFGLKT